MLWKFNSVYNPKLQLADHQSPPRYEMTAAPPPQKRIDPQLLYILPAKGRHGRALDDATEAFVDRSRTGTAG
jgi:hypothetical protein